MKELSLAVVGTEKPRLRRAKRLRYVWEINPDNWFGYGYEPADEQEAELYERFLARKRQAAERARMRYSSYSSSLTPEPKPSARTRRDVGCAGRVTSMSRSRSREQSHAPRRAARSTPKAAQRSGDSGDDLPAPEAALAALFQHRAADGRAVVDGPPGGLDHDALRPLRAAPGRGGEADDGVRRAVRRGRVPSGYRTERTEGV
jgi:hypothetical protein